MPRDKSSFDSLWNATKSRAQFSGHGNALGAKGYVSDTDDNDYHFLGSTGETEIINPHQHGYEQVRIGAAWQPLIVQDNSFLGKMMKKTRQQNVDLDLGCLYELQNGQRGVVQAFGDMFGDYDNEPFLKLSGDDRTGEDHDDDDGEDEVILLNGAKWPEIKRILIYLYIYDGARDWAQIQPQVQIRVPGESPVIVKLHTYKSELALCTVAEMVNIRNGIKLTNHTEYYPGHAEMDRAFGYGLHWADGQKEG